MFKRMFVFLELKNASECVSREREKDFWFEEMKGEETFASDWFVKKMVKEWGVHWEKCFAKAAWEKREDIC